MTLRILIVDDEPAVRSRLRAALRETRNVELVGECGDGLSALRVIRERTPDVVLLDVEMPGLDGFGVLEAIASGHEPRVILMAETGSTGLEVCERHSLEYLLKPVEREALAGSIGRAAAATREPGTNGAETGALARARAGEPDALGANGNGAGRHARMAAVFAELHREGLLRDAIVVRDRGRITQIRPAEIDWVEAAGNYVVLHCSGIQHLLRETMKGIESRLDGRRFLRVHRSKIVNLDRVRGVEPTEHGEFLILIEGGGRLRSGRGFTDQLREKLPDAGRPGMPAGGRARS
jgi:two-component system LytT family response regulator